MFRALALAMIFGLFSGNFGPAGAQNQPPEPAADRYRFQVTDQGVLRLDSRTGRISQCTVGASGAICRSAPDERAALEGEIARLEADNAALRKQLADRGLTAPPPVPPMSIPGVADKSTGPDGTSQPERGRFRTAIDTAWRSLVAIMARMKNTLQNER
jgi:hypothetical protein